MSHRTNRMLSAAAMLLAASTAIGQTTDDRLCADQNADGLVTPADFSSWVSNYNSNNPIADVNQDGIVSPADFSAWVSAFNLGEGGPGCTVDLGDGGHVTGSISYVGDVDTFIVQAEAGDDLLFTIDENPNTSIYLKVSMYTPDGTLYAVDWASSGYRLDRYDVPQSGTYTYVIEDYYGDYTGNYEFTLVVADEQVDPDNVDISSGTTYDASLTPGDIDTYTISANAGDDLLFTIDENPSSSSYFYVTLHGPDGEWIATEYASSGYRLDTYDLPETGRYTFIVREYYGQYEGDYSFTAVVADGIPDDSTVYIESGEHTFGTLGAGDIDTYTISANAGDDLLFTIDETTSTSAYVMVNLHGPNGELLAAEWASTGYRVDFYNVPTTGNYTYIIRDYYGQYDAEYALTAVVANGVADTDNVVLTSGQTIQDTLDAGDIDTFTINASAGDDIFFTIDETTSSSAYMMVTLHGPSGELLLSEWASTGYRLDLINAPTTGTYTYVVREYYGQYEAQYALTAVVADANFDYDNVQLSDGVPVAGTLDVADIDTFTISANAGQNLSLTIAETPSSSAYLYVSLHGPNGQLLAYDWASNGLTLNYNGLPATGRYTYVVHEYYGQYECDYMLTATIGN